MKLVSFSLRRETASNYAPRQRWGYLVDNDNKIIELADNYVSGFRIETGDSYLLDDALLRSPVDPGTVVAAAYNYKDLVGPKETYEDPLIFLKSKDSIIGPEEEIIIGDTSKRTWSEVELVIVVSKHCSNVSASSADEYILGYTVGNDITTENSYGRDHHLALSKARRTYGPIGPYIDTEFIPRSTYSLTNKTNGSVTQHGKLGSMILSPSQILSFISMHITLAPGDVIFTGTPANAMNSLITNGSRCEVSIEGLGTLINPVAAR